MRKLALFLLLPLAACMNETTPANPQPAAPTGAKLEILADTPQRLAKLPRTVIDYDRSLLNQNEQQVLALLIEASKHIDEIFWRQVSEENPGLRERLAKQASQSPLDQAGNDLFLAMKGRWDSLDEEEPFIAPFGAEGAKPKGAAFYPRDLTKEEFEAYIAANPSEKDALTGLYTVVRRDGKRLKAIPYSQHYKEFLDPAAAKLREAAKLTTNASLRDYLTKLADAFATNDYRPSDMAWMDLQGPIEVVIGPYEVYEDNLFNYKASFESFVTIVDKPESDKLAVYAEHLPDMERNLPEPEQYKNPNRGTESPIRVVQEAFTAGDARHGVQTAAFNLPNDEVVREQKGSKKVLLKNVMEAKYRQSGAPIANRVLTPELRSLISFDAFFNQVLFHELSHGLGPGLITQPDGKRVDVRILLKDTYSAIEECKADVLGLWNILYAQNNELLTTFDERQLYATYTGLMFRSMRFGVDEAHGRGTAVQWNWLREKGGIIPAANGTFTVDFDKFREGVKSLSTELLVTQATGDYARAQRLLEKYGVSNAEIESVNKGLTDIPVDINPVFPAAGEK